MSGSLAGDPSTACCVIDWCVITTAGHSRLPWPVRSMCPGASGRVSTAMHQPDAGRVCGMQRIRSASRACCRHAHKKTHGTGKEWQGYSRRCSTGARRAQSRVEAGDGSTAAAKTRRRRSREGGAVMQEHVRTGDARGTDVLPQVSRDLQLGHTPFLVT